MGNGILNTQHGDGNTKYISSTLYRDYTTDSAKSYKPRPAVAYLLQVCSCNLYFALKEVGSPCLVFLVVVHKFRPKAIVNKAYRSLLL